MSMPTKTGYVVKCDGTNYPIYDIEDGAKKRQYILLPSGKTVPYLGTQARTIIAGNGHSLSDASIALCEKLGGSVELMTMKAERE
jgi:hypothetical protein